MAEPASPPANRRFGDPSPAFLVLLTAAVVVASVFCFLYITGADGTSPPPPPAPIADAPPPLPAARGAVEETALEVEHVLVVEDTANNRLEKVIARVPAHFASGTVRWTPEQFARARQLRARLATIRDYQSQLAEELDRLQADWVDLITQGLPQDALRADSPSLPQATSAAAP